MSVIAANSSSAPTGADTLTLDVSQVTPADGSDALFTVSVDGVQVGGTQSVTAMHDAGQGQDIVLTGDFGPGPHDVTIDFLNGFSGDAADAGRKLFINAITLDNQTTFGLVPLLFAGNSNFAVQAPAAPVASNVGTADTLVLNLAEAAVGGADAQVMVSVDGQIVGGVQTVTASRAAGASQNITLTGDFGSGAHTVAIDFINGFGGDAADVGRTLYVNAITLDGVTTTENATQTFVGAQTYSVQGGDPTTTPPPSTPTVTITSQVLAHDTGASASDNVTTNGAVTLAGTVAGPAGTTVEILDGTTVLGQATLDGHGGWTYATSLASGSHALQAVASDPAGDTAASSTQPTIVVDTTPPTLTLNAPTEVAGAATAAVTVTGTVSAGATAVEIYSGSTDLGAATLDGKGGFSFTDSLAPGAYTFKAVATDLAGNTASAVDPVFNATVTPPVTTTTTPPTTSGPDTLVLNVSEIAVGGKNAQFIVDVDGQQVGGVQTVKASEPLGQSKNITLNGDFGAGPHTVTIQMLDGFTGAAADAGRTLFVNAITLDNSTTFTNGRLMFNGPVGYAVQGPATPVASNASGTDTLVLNVSGTAAGGANAQFAVSVDGQMISGVQLVKASHATGGSQTITLHGDFGSGPHTVAIDFVNGFSGAASDIGRTLYVNSITLDGLTTTENATQTYQGAQTYTVQAGDPTTSPPPVTPTVTITSQVLAHDTGASASDNVTNDGAVTLTGTVAGPAGTTVEIFDGTTDLGQATLNGAGGWTYATTLSSGDHTLHAVASDPAVSAAEPTIVVDNTPPTLTLNGPSQTLSTSSGTAATTLTGTIVDSLSATVQIMDGATVLGSASVNNGAWSYTANLSVGVHDLTAVAMDLAGNTATSAADAVTVTTAAGSPSATNITGNTANAAGENGIVVYNWDPTTQLQNWIAAETAVADGTPGAQARIVTFGDSTTQGIGAGAGQSWPDYLAAALGQDTGIATQSNNSMDNGGFTFLNGATWNYGLVTAGGSMSQLWGKGEGVQWNPTATSASSDRLDLSFWDSNGAGDVTVTATGSKGVFTETVQLAAGANIQTQTIDLPTDTYSQISVVTNNESPVWVQDMSLWNAEQPAIQVYNAGLGGSQSGVIGDGSLNGVGVFQGGLGVGGASLALIDYGLNDILFSNVTVAQTLANITSEILACRSVNCDPVIIVPEPFSLNPQLANNLETVSQLITGLEALAVKYNVPIIDLNSTYANDSGAYQGAGLIGFGVHPDAAGYQDIGSRIAALLTNTVDSYSNTATYLSQTPATVTGTSGNDVLFSTSVSNTLIGSGGSDTYIMNANDQTDTIVNGVAGATTPTGQLDIAAANHNQLWFEQSGSDLVVEILGTKQEAVVQNWFAGSNGAQLQTILANDGYELSNGAVQSLVQAMAGFSAQNAGFNPMTTTHASLADSYFTEALNYAIASSWHH